MRKTATVGRHEGSKSARATGRTVKPKYVILGQQISSAGLFWRVRYPDGSEGLISQV